MLRRIHRRTPFRRADDIRLVERTAGGAPVVRAVPRSGELPAGDNRPLSAAALVRIRGDARFAETRACNIVALMALSLLLMAWLTATTGANFWYQTQSKHAYDGPDYAARLYTERTHAHVRSPDAGVVYVAPPPPGKTDDLDFSIF